MRQRTNEHHHLWVHQSFPTGTYICTGSKPARTTSSILRDRILQFQTRRGVLVYTQVYARVLMLVFEAFRVTFHVTAPEWAAGGTFWHLLIAGHLAGEVWQGEDTQAAADGVWAL